MPDNERVNSPLDGSHGISDPNIARAYQSVKQGAVGDSAIAEAAVKKAMDTNLLADTLAKRIKLTGGDQQSKEEFNKVQEELRTLKEVLIQVARDIGGKVNPAEEMRVLRAAETVQRTNERFAPKAPERPTDFHDRYPNINRPGYDMDLVRSDVRVARSHRAMGGDVSQLPIYQDLLNNKDEIESQLSELHKSFTEERSKGTPEGRQAAREIATQIASTTNLRAELTNILEHSAGQQSSSFNKVMQFVSTLASTLGAASLISRFAISEPYRFETQPGLQIMGQQGQMGAVLGSAFSELESYKYELDQTAFMTGAGALATGIGMAVGGGSLGARIGGGALAVGGLAIGSLGLMGASHDLLSTIGLSKSEDEILGQALAKQFSDPSRLMSEFQNSRIGLYAMGGRNTNNFGMVNGSPSGSTGNTYLDMILEGDGGGDLLRSLGYNRESLGALGSSTAMRLRGSGSDIARYSRFAGEIGGVYGMGDEAVLSGLATAQRFGSKDAAATYSRFANVFAEGEGKDQTISEYAMNVLQPALLQVTESMAIRNLARSTEELEQEVTTFGRNVITGEGRLSELAQVNPQIIGTILQSLQQASSLGAEDTAIAALDMSLGATPTDIFLGRAHVGANRLEHIIRQGGMSEYGSADEFLADPRGIGTLRASQALMRMGTQESLGAIELAFGGNLLAPNGQELSEDALELEREARAAAISGSDPGIINQSLSKQVDDFLKIQTELMPQLKALQTSLSNFLGNENFLRIMSTFLDEKATQFQGIADEWSAGHSLDSVLGVEGIDDFVERQRGFTERGIDPGFGTAAASWLGPESRETVMGRMESDPDFKARIMASFTEAFPEGVDRTNWEDFEGMVRNVGEFGDHDFSRSVGGFTGMGGRHQPTGTVHAGEYVISSDNVPGNRALLDRIQSGEKVGSSSVTQGSGNVTYVTMKIHGASREEILSDARRVTEEYIVRNRLNYT